MTKERGNTPCFGCIHYDGCGYFEPALNKPHWSDEQRFQEHCVGCCCGDGCECNKDQGCDNYEDGTLPLMG